jgi:hypothetical protein
MTFAELERAVVAGPLEKMFVATIGKNVVGTIVVRERALAVALLVAKEVKPVATINAALQMRLAHKEFADQGAEKDSIALIAKKITAVAVAEIGLLLVSRKTISKDALTETSQLDVPETKAFLFNGPAQVHLINSFHKIAHQDALEEVSLILTTEMTLVNWQEMLLHLL